jgi:menaquinone-9 beta-reductase
MKRDSTPTDFDAVVIGAGPAGSAVAILLARAGWSVALVEKQSFPRRKVCGECIAASNWPLLEALGLRTEKAGAPLHHMVLMRGTESVSAALPRFKQLSPALPLAQAHLWDGGWGRAWGRALGRETLDTLLVEQARLSGVHVFQPCAVREVSGAAGSWRINIRPSHSDSEFTLTAPVAIAANGSWETLPSSRAHRRRPHLASDLFAFKANFRGTSLAQGLLPVLAFKGGYGGMVLGGDGVTTLACCVRRDELDAFRLRYPSLRAGDAVQALLSEACAGVRLALRGAVRDGVWLAAGPIAPGAPGIRLTESDGIFRVGNAAGEAHPIIGEGMSMALQSAWLLAGELLGLKGSVHAPSLAGLTRAPSAQTQALMARRYARQWCREFAPRLRLAAAFAHVAMRPALSRVLLSLARWMPSLLTWGARVGGKVHCAADPAQIAAVLQTQLQTSGHPAHPPFTKFRPTESTH